MTDIKLSFHHAGMLQDQLAHARKAFEMVAGNYYGSDHDIAIASEHVTYTLGVYSGFRVSILGAIDEMGLKDCDYKQWTPRGTVPRDLKGFLLEESLSTGMLLGWRDIQNWRNEGLIDALKVDQKRLVDAVRGDSNATYKTINVYSRALAISERAPEVMETLGKIRKRYIETLNR